jgi:hypothetical protein
VEREVEACSDATDRHDVTVIHDPCPNDVCAPHPKVIKGLVMGNRRPIVDAASRCE